MNQESQVVFIAGLTAAGKTTHSKLIVDRFSMKYVCGSDFLLAAFGLESSSISSDFWATPTASEINTQRSETRAVDRQIDTKLVDFVAINNMIVVDSWGGAWLSKKPGLRIWLESSLASRVWKAMISHGLPPNRTYSDFEKLLVEKDEFTRSYFIEEYGVDITRDHSVFDLKVDISEFLVAPTYEASRASISAVDEVIASFMNWYIDPSSQHLEHIIYLYNLLGRRVFLQLPSQISLHI